VLQALQNQGLVGVAYSDPASGIYLGSPSILTLPSGSLLASHDTFRGWGEAVEPVATYLYQSDDGGESWAAVGVAPDQYWSSLFWDGQGAANQPAKACACVCRCQVMLEVVPRHPRPAVAVWDPLGMQVKLIFCSSSSAAGLAPRCGLPKAAR
jgi:hypothetical protein